MVLEQIKKKAKKLKKTIIFPEGNDERILKAVSIIKKEKIADVIVLKENSLHIRLKQGFKLLNEGKGDALITGATHPTRDTIKFALFHIGTKNNIERISGAFFMVKDKDAFLFADCAVQVDPTVNNLVEIAKLSMKTFKIFVGKKPSVAMLSYSSLGSSKGESVNKVRLAAEHLGLPGEIQVDAALVEKVFLKKCLGKKFNKANVLIFPNLDTGNICYKIVERLAGYKAVGPVFQGLRKPVNDLSRGCSVQDIVDLAAVTAVQCES